MKCQSSVAELIKFLEQDAEDEFSIYPQQALYALRDDRVKKLIEGRLKNGETLKNITDIGYNMFTGLNHTVFVFTCPSVELGSSSLLAVTEGETCAVVGVVDPFDYNRPNPLLPSFPNHGEQPFILQRASVTEDLIIDQAKFAAAEARVKAFLITLGLTEDIINGKGTKAATKCNVVVPTNTIIAPSLMGEPPPSVQDYDRIDMFDD